MTCWEPIQLHENAHLCFNFCFLSENERKKTMKLGKFLTAFLTQICTQSFWEMLTTLWKLCTAHQHHAIIQILKRKSALQMVPYNLFTLSTMNRFHVFLLWFPWLSSYKAILKQLSTTNQWQIHRNQNEALNNTGLWKLHAISQMTGLLYVRDMLA